jgi:hypothetical protein
MAQARWPLIIHVDFNYTKIIIRLSGRQLQLLLPYSKIADQARKQ